MENRARLLIVDDHVDLAENLAEILVEAGHEADIAETAEQALECLSKAEYQGVITDFRLPGRNGVELLVELRRAGHTLPVVLVSAFADSDVVAEAEQVGALDVLPKPVDFDRLFSLVAEFDRGRRSVLVVDDNADLAEGFAEVLRSRGLEPVIVGSSAASALSQRALPRVAVLDVRLPDQSGIELARRLLARDPSLQVVFVTGYAEEARDVVQRVLPELSADGGEPAILTKPVDLELLVVRVSEAARQ